MLFYGGAAGGGKTDLLLGAALQHRKSILFRRVFPSLRAIIDRSKDIYNPENAYPLNTYNESAYRWKLEDGYRSVRFGAMQYDKDVTNFQGQPHDLYLFDELAEFSEYQFRFVTGWNRTNIRHQRCRVIAAGNPPTDSDGEWIVKFFAPWLDDSHPNPARSGELRWFTTIDGKDVEVEDGKGFYRNNQLIKPRSRTFILARLQDNPALRDSGYEATLQSLPEPLRSKMLFGDFKAGSEDNPWQVIPTEWLRLANERWKARAQPSTPLSAIGVDVARGGKDQTILTRRYDNYFCPAETFPGSATPDGPAVAALIQPHVAGRPGARVNIDIIGVGGSVYDCMKSFHKSTYAMNASRASEERDKSGQLGFLNKRAEWYWKLREALDPTSGQDLAIPPDNELSADLRAARWKISARGIQIEAKDEIKQRIGRSPDRGDSLVYAFNIETEPGAGWAEFFSQSLAEKGS